MSIKSKKKSINLKNDIEENNSMIKTSSKLDAQSLYTILIKNPYLVNSIDEHKETILSYSIKNQNISVSNLILTSPILDLDYQDKDGNSYLHLAIKYNQEGIVKSLIEKGISLDKQNKEGNTAINLVYNKNNKEIINILKENGIDINIENNHNKFAEKIKTNMKQSTNKYKVNANLENKVINKIKERKAQNLFINNKSYLNNKNTKTITQHHAKNKLNVNSVLNTKTSNNSNTMTASNSNGKGKINQSELIKKSKKVFDNNKETCDNCENNLSIDDYKNKIHNNENKNCPEYEKTIKMNWELAQKNLNKSKKNEENKYIKDSEKEKKSINISKDQDLVNFGDKNNFNSFSEESKKNENFNIPIKVNKKFFSNINTNPTSPKKKQKNKIKKINKNKNRNSNKNSCLGNTVAINNNIYLSNDYSIKSERSPSNNPSRKYFHSNKDLSSSTENINHFDESKLNFIMKNNIKNNNKNQSKNSSIMNITNQEKNVIKNNNDDNNEESINSNAIIKSSKISNNSLNNQIAQIKQKEPKNNNSLIEFLSQINLIKYYNNMILNGFDDINILTEEAKKGALIHDQELKEIGISLPGDRAKILIRIKEKANNFGFTVPKGVYHVCRDLDKLYEDKYILELNNWLKSIKVESYLINFINSGYHSLELLLIQMETESPINQEILNDEIGIDIIGYRSRILNKLKEDGKSLNNKLKTTTLVVNNIGNDKNCECLIY